MKADKNRIIRLILAGLCLCITIGCAVYLGSYFLDIKRSQDNVDSIKDLVVEPSTSQDSDKADDTVSEIQFVDVNGRMVQEKYAEIYRTNPHFVGWITIPDTKVDYPVMQNPDENEYYINRNFDQEWDGSGLPFLDIRCDFNGETDNQLIYAHNMKSGTMFAGIIDYADEDFYKAHKTLTFNTIEGDAEYEVIAAFYSQVYAESDTAFKYYQFFDADSKEEFDAYIDNVKALTPYEIEASANYGDTLITLSTCAYHVEDGRFAIVARKIEEE